MLVAVRTAGDLPRPLPQRHARHQRGPRRLGRLRPEPGQERREGRAVAHDADKLAQRVGGQHVEAAGERRPLRPDEAAGVRPPGRRRDPLRRRDALLGRHAYRITSSASWAMSDW
jgi:hypothetical protein